MEKLSLAITALQDLLKSLQDLQDAWSFNKSKRWLTRRWVRRPFFQEKEEKGFYKTTFEDLKKDPDMFFKFFRMNLSTIEELFYLCEPFFIIHRQRADGVCALERLIITLRYLASGDEIFSFSVAHRVSESTILEVIKSTCTVIVNALSPVYLKRPNKVAWRNIAKGFEKYWNLANCCGAIDGQHIAINAPANSTAMCFNYKKFYSIVLLAVCNHRYEFTLVDVGACGGESDGGIFRRCPLGIDFGRGELDIPTETPKLPGSDIKTPYFWVGDDAFSLSTKMMKPFKLPDMTREERIYNYRISRARRCIENAFGILVARWRVFNKPLAINPEDIKSVVSACICLHNFMMGRKSEGNEYCPDNYVDRIDDNGQIIDGTWRSEISPNNVNNVEDTEEDEAENPVQEAEQMRQALKNYFVSSAGLVPWQDDYINRGLHGDVEGYCH